MNTLDSERGDRRVAADAIFFKRALSGVLRGTYRSVRSPNSIASRVGASTPTGL